MRTVNVFPRVKPALLLGGTIKAEAATEGGLQPLHTSAPSISEIYGGTNSEIYAGGGAASET